MALLTDFSNYLNGFIKQYVEPAYDALLFEQKKVFFGDRWKGGVSEKILGPKEEYRDVHSWTSPGNYETEYAHRQGSIDWW